MVDLTDSNKENSQHINQFQADAGTLYVVATPIGNISDISYRAIETLQQVNLICAEDTRHSQRLMSHYDITTPMISLHEHNEEARIEQIAEKLNDGLSVALISDAGTPLISDPGFKLVRGLRQKGFRISPIPGASALISALSVAGLATDSFSFWGFLPSKSKARKERYEALSEHKETLVFYESSHRIADSLKDLSEVMGDRHVVIAREITKNFETILSGVSSIVLEQVINDPNQQKGEFVVMVEGVTKVSVGDEISQEARNIMAHLISELPPNKAAKLAAQITGAKKKDLYQWALQQKAD
ncbi:16S rRNA (cytidine(1402)-2'-O)-methyltransferase [Kangiella geojedonensis]|uniref:Ribosomal RNA small subunit methyltransferase I n=1 Tax=Kangiella geojedonensis TaxID=914150 RepID=A0A0F6TRA7_9GAMM|nr:16S rRNA (cytidine(1402)-2'-O)-methyltransferase [Kangiella geojedonensis]AKE52654.1 16S rRNA methyltransferase [Kangiella geojedonensis]